MRARTANLAVAIAEAPLQLAVMAATGLLLGLSWTLYGALRLLGRAPVHR